MSVTLNQRLAKYGEWTYRGAWILEITASLIGLGTGLALGYQALVGARNDPGTSISDSEVGMAFLLQSAPFFMVALAELTKIPIATLLFSARWRWKPFILVFLVLLAGITFETVFMGLERAVTLRQLAYEGITKQISDLRAEAKHLDISTEQIKNPAQIPELQAEREKINTDVAQERSAIQKQASEIDAEIEGHGLLSPEAAAIRDKLQLRESAYASLVSERDKRLSDEVAQFEHQRDSFVERLKGLQQTGDAAARQKVQDQLDRLANPRILINAKYTDKVTSAEAEIKALRQSLDDARAKEPPQTSQHLNELQARRSALTKQLDQTNNNWQQQLDKLNTRLSEAQTLRQGQDQQLQIYGTRQAEIQKSLAELDAKRTTQARLDQVRRIASRFYGKSPETVSEDEAGFISVVWFGSLALLAALLDRSPRWWRSACSELRINARDSEKAVFPDYFDDCCFDGAGRESDTFLL